LILLHFHRLIRLFLTLGLSEEEEEEEEEEEVVVCKGTRKR
jgi:hypothetical protein